jgi:hypothetical protein
MTDEIFVPPTASDPKPWWTQRPGESLIEEILTHIAATSQPFLWAGQTYNKPDKDSPIDYLAEFHLPKSKPLAPCPCCTPRNPKYRHGMIAWFPNESIIRIIGADCFKTINSHGHVEALKTFHAAKRRKSDIAYLLNHLDKVPELIRALEHAALIGHAVDDFRHAARAVFKEVLHADLWDLLRTGELRITRLKKQVVFIQGQGEEEREFPVTETFAKIAGQNFLKPKSPRIGLRLEHALVALHSINIDPPYDTKIREMSADDRAKHAKFLSKAVDTANMMYAEINDLKQFTAPMNLSSLNAWCRIKECPIHIHLSFDGNNLHIGRSEYDTRRVEVPPAYNLTLRPLPQISKKAVAA